MNIIKLIGTILTGVGAILLGIAGIIYLFDYVVLNVFLGITLLILGAGLLLNSIYACPLCKKKI